MSTIADHRHVWLAVPVPNPNWVAESRRDQGLPPVVSDPAAVRVIAALLDDDPETPSDEMDVGHDRFIVGHQGLDWLAQRGCWSSWSAAM